MALLLVGIGRWGKNHLKVLTQLVDEIYVVDLDPHQLETCKEFSIPADHLSTNYLDFIGNHIHTHPPNQTTQAGLLTGGILLSSYQYFFQSRLAKTEILLCL